MSSSYYGAAAAVYMVAAIIGLIIAIALGIICKNIGVKKGYGAGISFCAGFFLGLIGLVVMLVLEDKNRTKTAQTPSVESVADEIIKYKQLLDEGIITEEEFSAKKTELLD